MPKKKVRCSRYARVWNAQMGWYTDQARCPNCWIVDGVPVYWRRDGDRLILYRFARRVKVLELWTVLDGPTWDELEPRWRKALLMRFVTKGQVVSSGPAVPRDPHAEKTWPALWEYLTARFWDDERKQPRKTATITIFLRDDGRLGATLADKDQVRTCFAVGSSVLGVLAELEEAVADPKTQWREDRNQTGGSARRKN